MTSLPLTPIVLPSTLHDTSPPRSEARAASSGGAKRKMHRISMLSRLGSEAELGDSKAAWSVPRAMPDSLFDESKTFSRIASSFFMSLNQ